MEEIKTKVFAWIQENKIIAGVVGVIVALFLFEKFGGTRRRRRRVRTIRATAYRRRRTALRNKPAVRRRKYNRTPAGKKAWQVKGSPAAKRRMAELRRRRSRKLI